MEPAPDKPVGSRSNPSPSCEEAGARRVAVVVPGILGSKLFYEDYRGPLVLWDEDMIRNYFQIRNDATQLKWEGKPANSSLLKGVLLPRKGWWKVRLWDKLLSYLRGHQDFGEERIVEFSYDWRQCLLDTAEQLGMCLEEKDRVLTSEGSSSEQPRYTFFTHSMGGLVVRIALALKAVDPARVDRIVHLGSPLLGAPAAFNAVYGDGPLPVIEELMAILRRFPFLFKNKGQFTEHLLQQLRTFPSVYQLLPPVGHRYITHDYHHNSFNPLDPGQFVIEADMREKVEKVHRCLEEASILIADQEGLEVATIYGEHHRRRTEEAYRVEVIQGLNTHYKVRELIGSTERGDGTVPEWSARGPDDQGERKGIDGIGHLDVCNDDRVLKHVRRMEARGGAH